MWNELKAASKELWIVPMHIDLQSLQRVQFPTFAASTASISPCTESVEIRDYADSRTIYPMPFLTNENEHLYTEAYDINPYELIDLYAAAQQACRSRHFDDAYM